MIFSFDKDFQLSLMRMLLEDNNFTYQVKDHLDKSYFTVPALSWMWSQCLNYFACYQKFPTIRVLKELASKLEPSISITYLAIIDQVCSSDLKDEEWLRERVFDFVKRNLFVKAFTDTQLLYNSGKQDRAYDLMMGELEKIVSVKSQDNDRSWICDTLPERHSNRLSEEAKGDVILTGMPWLDKVLDGGLGLGELGIWLGGKNSGKSTMLINHGVSGVRLANVNVLHILLEGSLKQLETRYDSAFSNELYNNIKNGNMENYTALFNEYQQFKSRLVGKCFTDGWSINIVDIDNEIKELWRTKGWKPKLIIIDYCDLLSCRGSAFDETAKQRDAVRDIKTLAAKGPYGIWSASQGQRPNHDEDAPFILKSKNMAGAYEKVRIADFLGSINLTPAERAQKMCRLYAEYYRDNAADFITTVRCDFSRMCFQEEYGLMSPSQPGLVPGPLHQGEMNLSKPKRGRKSNA